MGAIGGIKNLTLFAAFLLFVESVHSLKCYQCISTNNTDPFQCNEFLTSDVNITPQPCDAVFGAQYCVKHTGRFEGKTISAVQVTYHKKGNLVAKLGTLKPN
ncbi:hypothetical protein QLX08_004510 [Tetragonisca angustula]|uniref:Protein sleepless n=1 Tax=Tetragonisca angustula TaxID=166442 RepID=A0AAW1A209_9HYME